MPNYFLALALATGCIDPDATSDHSAHLATLDAGAAQ